MVLVPMTNCQWDRVVLSLTGAGSDRLRREAIGGSTVTLKADPADPHSGAGRHSRNACGRSRGARKFGVDDSALAAPPAAPAPFDPANGAGVTIAFTISWSQGAGAGGYMAGAWSTSRRFEVK